MCRTDTDGVVTWEGPPGKVEQRKGAEEAQKRMLAERDAAFAAAEKRPPTEPIRVAIVGPSAASPGVQCFVLQYRQMFLEAMQGDPRLQLVDAGKIAHLLKPSSSGMSSRNSGPPANVDEAMAKRVRDGGGEVDVLVVVTAKEKEKTGFVSGGGGSGMAQVVNVEFNASLSSVYAFAEQRHAEVGNSTAGIQMAGVGQVGQAAEGRHQGHERPLEGPRRGERAGRLGEADGVGARGRVAAQPGRGAGAQPATQGAAGRPVDAVAGRPEVVSARRTGSRARRRRATAAAPGG